MILYDSILYDTIRYQLVARTVEALQKAKAATRTNPFSASLSLSLSLSLPGGRAKSKGGDSEKAKIEWSRVYSSSSAPSSPQKRKKQMKKNLLMADKHIESTTDCDQGDDIFHENQDQTQSESENEVDNTSESGRVVFPLPDTGISQRSEPRLDVITSLREQTSSSSFCPLSASLSSTLIPVQSSDTPLTPSSNSVTVGPGSPTTPVPYARSNSLHVLHASISCDTLPPSTSTATSITTDVMKRKLSRKASLKDPKRNKSGTGSGSERTPGSKIMDTIAGASIGSGTSKRRISATTSISTSPAAPVTAAVGRKLSIGVECRVFDENEDNGPSSQDRYIAFADQLIDWSIDQYFNYLAYILGNSDFHEMGSPTSEESFHIPQ